MPAPFLTPHSPQPSRGSQGPPGHCAADARQQPRCRLWGAGDVKLNKLVSTEPRPPRLTFPAAGSQPAGQRWPRVARFKAPPQTTLRTKANCPLSPGRGSHLGSSWKGIYLLENLFLPVFLSSISRERQHTHTGGNWRSPQVPTARQNNGEGQGAVPTGRQGTRSRPAGTPIRKAFTPDSHLIKTKTVFSLIWLPATADVQGEQAPWLSCIDDGQ